MLWLTILLCVIGIVFSLLGLLLITKVSLIIQYRESFIVYLKIFFIKMRLNKDKNKIKKQKLKRLKNAIENSNNATYPSAKDFYSNAEKVSQGANAVIENVASSAQNNAVSESSSNLKSRFQAIKQKIKNLSDSHKKNSDKAVYIYELIKVFLPDFSKYLKVRIRCLEICVSCPDAKDTALLYALYHTSLCQIFALFDEVRLFKVNPNKTYLSCDYSGKNTKFCADISLSIYVWQMLKCTVKPLFKHLKLQRKETQKNG